jgi:hypothetical protein
LDALKRLFRFGRLKLGSFRKEGRIDEKKMEVNLEMW